MLEIRNGGFSEVLAVHLQVPELSAPKGIAAYQDRIGSRPKVTLIASVRDAPVAFKLGYAVGRTKFYSWIGGVVPAHRGKGIAQKLIDEQERVVAERGFSVIEVKSMNKHKNMLKLLISNGYRISGHEPGNGPDDAKILFTKRLTDANRC